VSVTATPSPSTTAGTPSWFIRPPEVSSNATTGAWTSPAPCKVRVVSAACSPLKTKTAQWLTPKTGAKADDFAHRFSTKPLDQTTGLYYYGYRDYDAASGRWTGRDPIGEEGGLNLYGMVGNDAAGKVDVIGLSINNQKCCKIIWPDKIKLKKVISWALYLNDEQGKPIKVEEGKISEATTEEIRTLAAIIFAEGNCFTKENGELQFSEYDKIAAVFYNRLGKRRPGGRLPKTVSSSIMHEIKNGGWESYNKNTEMYSKATNDESVLKLIEEECVCLRKAIDSVIKIFSSEKISFKYDQFRTHKKGKNTIILDIGGKRTVLPAEYSKFDANVFATSPTYEVLPEQ